MDQVPDGLPAATIHRCDPGFTEHTGSHAAATTRGTTGHDRFLLFLQAGYLPAKLIQRDIDRPFDVALLEFPCRADVQDDRPLAQEVQDLFLVATAE